MHARSGKRDALRRKLPVARRVERQRPIICAPRAPRSGSGTRPASPASSASEYSGTRIPWRIAALASAGGEKRGKERKGSQRVGGKKNEGAQSREERETSARVLLRRPLCAGGLSRALSAAGVRDAPPPDPSRRLLGSQHCLLGPATATLEWAAPRRRHQSRCQEAPAPAPGHTGEV